MDDMTNLEAQAAPEVEDAPEVETEAQETETEATEVELDEDGNPAEGEPEPDSEAEDFVEVTRDGKAYKIPAALRDEFLMQADYTRKTQELAETRKAIEATLTQARQVTEAEQAAAVQIAMIDAQIADFNTIDWDAWEESDPVAANRAWRQFTQIKDSRSAAIQQHQQAQQQRTLLEQQETAKLIEQGQRTLAEKIPAWGPEKAVALQTHAHKAYGFTPEELNGIVDPRMIEVLHDAYQYRQQAKQQHVAKKVEVQQAVKPAAKVAGGKSPPRGLDDRLSTSEWIERFYKRRANQ